MTPEDTSRIVAAIDRNRIDVLESMRKHAAFIVLQIFLSIVMLMLFSTYLAIRLHATPLLPEITYEIGTPPLPPPNPNVQYSHTQYVPGPQGVLPVEVLAPRLVAQVASDAAVVDVPEPGTGLIVTAGVLALICFGSVFYQQTSEMRKLKSEIYRRDAYIGRCRYALRQIQLRIADESELREIARRALEE